MIHTSFSSYVAVAAIATGIAAILLLSGRRPRYRYYLPWQPVVGTSIRSGLAVAALLTMLVATFRHKTLARNAANAHLSVAHVLASGFGGTFIVVTVVVLIFLAGRRL